MKTAFLIGVWLVGGFINTGFCLAEYQRADTTPEVAGETYRADLAFAVFYSFAFAPMSWVVTFFLTWFWKHGWMIRRQR